MVAEGDHFAVDLDSADTASGHAATPDPPRARVAGTDEAPRDPRRGASPRYAPTSRRPPDDLRAPQLDFCPWLFALIGRAPDVPQVAACNGHRRSTAVSR